MDKNRTAEEKAFAELYKEYTIKKIDEEMKKCEDIGLLDFIHKLLYKSRLNGQK